MKLFYIFGIAFFILLPVFSENVSLISNGNSLTEVLLILADHHKINLVISPDIPKIPLRMRINDVPFEEALQLICQTSDLQWKKTDSVYTIFPNSKKYQDFFSRVIQYKFEHIHPKYILHSLETLFKNYDFSVSDHSPILFIRGYFDSQTEKNLSSLSKNLDYPRIMVQSTLTFQANSLNSIKEKGIDNIDFNDKKQEINLKLFSSSSHGETTKSSQLITAVGEPGKIFVGEEIFISQGMDSPPVTKKVGIDVEFNPISVNSSNQIQIHLIFSSSRIIGISPGNYPEIGQERFETTIVVPANQDYPVSIYDDSRDNYQSNSLPNLPVFSKNLLSKGLNGLSLILHCTPIYPVQK